MSSLLQKFDWVIDFPFGDIFYDPRTKSIFTGSWHNRDRENKYTTRIAGCFRILKIDTTIYTGSAVRYKISKKSDALIIVDTRTNEVAMINPLMAERCDIIEEMKRETNE
jgi:hypothetical protein